MAMDNFNYIMVNILQDNGNMDIDMVKVYGLIKMEIVIMENGLKEKYKDMDISLNTVYNIIIQVDNTKEIL